MIHWDNTITLGTVVVILSFVITIMVAYTKATRWVQHLDDKLELHNTTLLQHTERMDRFELRQTQRMDRYEQRYVEMAGTLQRLLGRFQGRRTGEVPTPVVGK